MTGPSELRRDPAGVHWVIIAPERAKRPDEFEPRPLRKPGGSSAACPFCPGREDRTPPEVAAIRPSGSAPDGPGWNVRVVPNKFPAVGRPDRAAGAPSPGLFHSREGFGIHEVVIEAPDHGADFSSLSTVAAGAVVRTWRDRLRALEGEAAWAYVQLFKNHGREAGASLSHPHSQIVALPLVPGRIREEIDAAVRFRAEHGICLHCRVLAEEDAAGRRIILSDADHAVTAPFASRFPYEMHIHPRRHAARFAEIGDGEAEALGALFRTVLGRLRRSLEDPPFNLILHQAPARRPGDASAEEESLAYHWHFEILPVLTRAAGFEWATGIHINPVPPEKAAAVLRRDSA
jgi:UDPglucose--hexose-1-phosphate uridylyltransferase